VTIATNPTGLDIIVDLTTYTAPQKFWWVNGSDHDIDVVTPQDLVPGSSRYAFAFWSDGEAQFHSVTVDRSETITASFDLEYKVTIASSPTGRDITVDLTPYVTPEEFWVVSGDSLDVQGTSPQPGATGTRYVFKEWSDGPATFDRTITVTAAATYTVVFTTEYEVTIATSPVGLQITVDTTTLTAPQTFWWDDGTSYSVDVDSPQAGGTGIQYVFSSWSDGEAQAHTITPTGPATYTATFTTQYYLNVISDYGNPTGEDWYDAGTTATFSVTSPFTSGDVEYEFTGWSGDSTESSKSATIVMSGPRTVEAEWREVTFLEKSWWIFPIIIIIIIVAILALWMMKRKKPEEEELPPPEEMEIPPEEEEV